MFSGLLANRASPAILANSPDFKLVSTIVSALITRYSLGCPRQPFHCAMSRKNFALNEDFV